MTEWWKSGVIYQIYPRSFQDSNGDGVGDLNGITARLDYLQWLGIDALWLSPIYTSPMVDFGYDVADYRGIDPLFGTLDDFDRLLAEAHARDLKVILDFVPNHTSDQHPWFIESRSARDNPKRDWYIWRDPKPNGEPPNNWLAYFGGVAWTFDAATGQYYLHNFAPQQPELNYRNPEVKAAVLADMRFWLERGVDGFRIDVIDRLLKDMQFRDNPPNPNYVMGRDNPMTSQLRLYSEAAPGTLDIIREMHHMIHSYPNRVTIGEIAYTDDIGYIAQFYGGSPAEATMDLPFNFNLVLLPWRSDTIRQHVRAYEEGIPAHGWTNYVLGNHDMMRIATRTGGVESARAAALLLLTLRGTPFIYYGDEIGMKNVPIPQHMIQDPQGKNVPSMTRDVVRTPMQWDASPSAGFSDTTPWLPLSGEAGQVNIEALSADPTSILTLYQRLLAYRRATPALQTGRYIEVDYPPNDCLIYLRQHDEQRRLVAINFADQPKTVAISGIEASGIIALSTLLDRDGTLNLHDFTLRPHEGLLIELT
jgi:alpha-glucosidase